jgi:uncharacterized protein (DUF1778 family)
MTRSDASSSDTERSVEDASLLRLSPEDQLAYAEMILNPPAHTQSLIRAAQSYIANFGSDVSMMDQSSRSDS